ncbi:hypothetical protein BG004_005939 [Podila humilis]|nr:hypothetical protein BG004_005939 [Podila humilis]
MQQSAKAPNGFEASQSRELEGCLAGLPPIVSHATATETPPTIPIPDQAAAANHRKRPKPVGLTKHCVHRPFKSPLRTVASPDTPTATSSSTTTAIMIAATAPSHITPACYITALQPSSKVLGDQLCLTSKPLPFQHLTKSPFPKSKPKFARSQFRPPLPRTDSASISSSTKRTPVGQFLDIQKLESQISELRSGIRNCCAVLRSQEREDEGEMSLEELTAKWKRVSQQGALVLMNKMVEQEQVFGGATGWDGGGFTDSELAGATNSDSSQLNRQSWIDMTVARMDYEETIGDLPTVSEALRTRTWPDVPVTKPPTKMQTMLMTLDVDLDTIGYDPSTDSFATVC